MSSYSKQVGVIIATLRGITALTDITTHDGVDNIYWQQANEGTQYPYALVFHQAGGKKYETRVQASDTVWRIMAYTKNRQEAINLLNAIQELDGAEPTIGTMTDIQSYGTIQEIMPLDEIDVIQNQSIYCVGGLYRFRFQYT